MDDFSISFTRALEATDAAAELAHQAEQDLGGRDEIAGACVLATAAAGDQGLAVGRDLGGRWAEAALCGTSFEGIVGEGRIWRDEPAVGMLAWRRGGHREPIGIAFEPGEQVASRIAEEMLCAVGREQLGPSDLVLLFPDAYGSSPIEPTLPSLEALLGRPAIAGAGASGLDGAPARAWVGPEVVPGGLLGVIVPGPESVGMGDSLVETAGASLAASSWRRISECRSRWVDGVDGESTLVWIRRELGLDRGAAVEPYLDRLLVRFRRRSDEGDPGDDAPYAERYVVGIDPRRGAISLPLSVRRGDTIALALPDPDRAREVLAAALSAVVRSPWLLQFACRARDERLHGDPDLEPAWLAAHAPGRRALGTVGPFQLGPDSRGFTQLLVHSTVLASLVAS